MKRKITRRRQLPERKRGAATLRLPRRALKGISKPVKPREWCDDPDKWLDNTNIEGVLKQYEQKYKWFRLLGVYPIDFAAPNPYLKSGGVGAAAAGSGSGPAKCLEPLMCSVTVPQLREDGIRYAAAVFNLDNHLQSGSHWVACVINVSKPAVYYFDSYGLPPPLQVETFMRSLANEEPRLLSPTRIGFNGRRFQYGGTECGMYSLYFVIAMIHDIPFRRFVKHPIPDKEMIALRDILFDNQCGNRGRI
jgi:hypothetical protein